MDEIREDKLICYRRIEDIIKNIEETEAKKNEAIRLKLASNRRSIGPANDLLRFHYILEQQYQSDSNEIRTKTRENVLEYFDQFRSSDDVLEEDNNDQSSDESEESTPITPPNPQPPPIIPQPPSIISHTPPIIPQTAPIIPQTAPIIPQTAPIIPQTAPIIPQTAPIIPQMPADGPSPSKPAAAGGSQPSLLVPVTDPEHIRPDTIEAYQKLLIEAQKYESHYKKIDAQRKKQLQSCIKVYLNKLRKETFNTLTNEFFEFLNGQEQKIGSESIRVLNEEERLLCLSLLATNIFSQLLGGDLNDVKTDIFLPLIGIFSENQKHKEFRIVFLEHLHKKCPYTVPFYPKRLPTMTDKQYYEAMGYGEKQEGDQRRLETETEFLNRMSGLIRLFCKLLVRRSPPFDNNLQYAWRWCSDVLNLPPRSNLTAVLLRIFLDEAGESMMREYPTQFPKIIAVIQRYLSKLEEVTSTDQMARLRLALEPFTK